MASVSTTSTMSTRSELVLSILSKTQRAGTALERLDWIKDWTNLVAAGGFIAHYLQPAAKWNGDIDLFVVSPTPLLSDDIRNIFKNILNWLHCANMEFAYHSHSDGTLTLLVNYPDGMWMKLQLIYSQVYASVQRLLDSFDMDVCRCAYVGPHISSYTVADTSAQQSSGAREHNTHPDSAWDDEYPSVNLQMHWKSESQRWRGPAYRSDGSYCEPPTYPQDEHDGPKFRHASTFHCLSACDGAVGTIYKHAGFVECVRTRTCYVCPHAGAKERMIKYQARYPTFSFQLLDTATVGFSPESNYRKHTTASQIPADSTADSLEDAQDRLRLGVVSIHNLVNGTNVPMPKYVR